MAYIGNQPTTTAFLTDTFSANGSGTVFTLSAAPANTNSIIVAVSGVLQDPSTYSVSGTTLTFSAAPPAGTGNISVRFLGIPASGVTTTAYRTVTEFTATAGQTTFTPPSYTVGYINVYRNGALLGTADYTATNGTTVVLASAASSGDLVVVESFYVSSVLNAIPAVANAVTTSYINSGAVTAAKMAASGAWAPVGTVVQVVSTTTNATFSSSSTSMTSTGIGLSITPTSASSKVLVRITGGNIQTTSGNAQPYFTVYRGASSLYGARGLQQCWVQSGGGFSFPLAIETLDSPATTSSTTYTLYMAVNSITVGVNTPDNAYLTITLMEIAA